MSTGRTSRKLAILAAATAAWIALVQCSLVNAPDEPDAAVGPWPAGGGGSGGTDTGGAPPGCANGEKDGSESDVDCGGADCPACSNGLECLRPSDCESTFCDTSQQPLPLCEPCLEDTDCAATVGSYCEEQVCAPQKEAGSDCSEPRECLSAFCVDSVCCDTACDGSCDGCAVPDHVGTCTLLPAGAAGDPSCAPYLCSGTEAACPTDCSGPADCTTEAFCESGTCLGQKALGAACDNGPECLSTFCVDSVCCETASCGTADDCNICQPTFGTCGNAPLDHECSDGLYCNGPDRCDGAGTCGPSGAGPCADSVGDGDADCSEGCDEDAETCTANEPDGTPCDDTLYCNGADTCSAGVCTAHAGNPCPGQDVGPSCTDSCDENANDCGANDQDGTPCTTCSSGNCTPCNAGVCGNAIPTGCAATAVPGIVICISNNKVSSYATASHCAACTEKGLTNACVDNATCRQGYTNAIIEQLYLQRAGTSCTAQTNQTGTCGWGEIMTPNYQPAGVCPTPQDCTDSLNWQNCTFGTGGQDAYVYGVCHHP